MFERDRAARRLGQVLELRARDATGGAIKALLGLAPRTALRIDASGNDVDVAIDGIAVAFGPGLAAEGFAIASL